MTTIALATVGITRTCGVMRSSTEPTQRVAGHASESDRARHGEEEQPGGGAASRAQARELGAGPALEPTLDQVPQRLAPERIAGLDRERVQRPEVFLRHAKQGAPAEPGDGKGDENDQDGSRSRGLGETDPGFSDPGGQSERREAEQHGGQEDRERQGERELGQADFGEKTAENRKKRALLGGGPVVLHVAAPGIEDRLAGTAREARSIVFGGGVVHARCCPAPRLSRGGACSGSVVDAACGFPALRSPVCFASRIMGPILPERLSALVERLGSH